MDVDQVEKKTTVINTSKNIYKPCFNMPAKEPKQNVVKPERKEQPRPTPTSTKTVSKKQSANVAPPMKRSDSRSKLDANIRKSTQGLSTTQTGKTFAKPKFAYQGGSGVSEKPMSSASSRRGSITGRPPKAEVKPDIAEEVKNET